MRQSVLASADKCSLPQLTGHLLHLFASIQCLAVHPSLRDGVCLNKLRGLLGFDFTDAVKITADYEDEDVVVHWKQFFIEDHAIQKKEVMEAYA